MGRESILRPVQISHLCKETWGMQDGARGSLKLQHRSDRVLENPKGSSLERDGHCRSPVLVRKEQTLVSLPFAIVAEGCLQTLGASAQKWKHRP